ncbi:MAG: hypothetical protein H6656_01790 [Ardenticatenaceae bacterium]|nr:hypothetical protein [Ardenticatenaceae bacterium]
MLGCQPEEIIGKNILNFTYHEDHPKLIQAQMQNMEGVSCSYEARLCPNDELLALCTGKQRPKFQSSGTHRWHHCHHHRLNRTTRS